MLKTCQFCGKGIKKGNEIKIFNDFAKIIVNSKKFVQIKKINIIEKILKVLR